MERHLTKKKKMASEDGIMEYLDHILGQIVGTNTITFTYNKLTSEGTGHKNRFI